MRNKYGCVKAAESDTLEATRGVITRSRFLSYILLDDFLFQIQLQFGYITTSAIICQGVIIQIKNNQCDPVLAFSYTNTCTAT